jgi:myo-inositol-1(or 4)-monophosphatase
MFRPPVTNHDLTELRDVIITAANAAAEIVRAAAPTARKLVWEEKGTADFVSAVDRQAEERIAAIVRERFPDAAILGEELSPNARAESGLLFLVDPLDGTTNFMHGYPEFAVSIAAQSDGDLVAGAVLNVSTRELFTATQRGGAYCNGEPTSVSSIDNPARALIGTGFPFRQIGELSQYMREFDLVARRTAGVRRAGSAALDLADVACGRFDAFWELTLSPWDVAAGILLIREAGGVVTDLEGVPATPHFGGYVAGNPAMHAWLMRTLDEADPD